MRSKSYATVKTPNIRLLSWNSTGVCCDPSHNDLISDDLCLRLVTEQFAQVKKETTLILERGRVALDENTPEVQEQYKQIEKDRVEYETAVKEAEEKGLAPPKVPDSIDMRSSEELQAELATQRAKLDITLNTNPGVIEQYEKRKRDVRHGSFLWETLRVTAFARSSNSRKLLKEGGRKRRRFLKISRTPG